jgi:hypothetical protein
VIGRSLLSAVLILGASATLKVLSPSYISPELARRLLGLVLGWPLIVYSNAIPKAVTPMVCAQADPATVQALRRFAGWGLVLGGLAFIAAWLFAPLEIAIGLATCLLAAALAIVTGRFMWSRARR